MGCSHSWVNMSLTVVVILSVRVMVSILSWLSWSMQPAYSFNSSCILNANGNLRSQILYFLMRLIFIPSLKKNFQKLYICNYCTLWFVHQTEVLKWKVSQHGDNYDEIVMTSLLNIKSKSMTFGFVELQFTKTAASKWNVAFISGWAEMVEGYCKLVCGSVSTNIAHMLLMAFQPLPSHTGDMVLIF